MDSLGRTGPWLLSIGALVIPGVSAADDLAPVIASGAVASFLFLLLVVVIVFSLSADTWVRSIMKSYGRVKMPKKYFEKKKETKRRLLNESMRSSRATQDTILPSGKLVNGNTPASIPVADKVDNRESMVQGWNQGTKRMYEEKGYTMELGEENDEEFHIETSIVDNEVLDVGPYTNLGSSSARPVDGNVYNDPYIYTNNDRVTVTRSSDASGGVVSATNQEMREIPSHSGRELGASNGGAANGAFNIEDHLIKL